MSALLTIGEAGRLATHSMTAVTGEEFGTLVNNT
jgi:hypothetical protein